MTARPRFRTHWGQRFRLLAAWLRRQPRCPGLPVSAVISSTSRCNLKCPMCPRAVADFANQDMDLGLFRQIVDQGARYFEYIVPQGGGEPMLHPGLEDMIRHTRSRGIRIGFSTNATLLRADRVEALLDSGLDTIIFAFDGTTPDVYETYRPGARFVHTRANILHFLERKRARRAKVHVTLQMVRLPGNAHQIEDFRRMWCLPGVDETRVKEDEIGVEGVGFPPVPGPRRNPCHFLWQGPLFIREDGAVFPCCYAWQAEPLGHVGQRPLTEIWNGDRIQAMRRAHARGDVNAFPECVGCLAPRPRWPLILGSFLVDAYHLRRFIPLVEWLNRKGRLPLFERKT